MCFLYQSEYVDSVFAGINRDGVRLDLIAGTHHKDFPYYGDEPWDNILLSVDSRRIQQTVRVPGLVRFNPYLGTIDGTCDARLTVKGPAIFVDSHRQIDVDLQIDMTLVSLPARQEAKRYNFLDIRKIPGLRWHPFVTERAQGAVGIGKQQWLFENLTGQVEHGQQSNLRAKNFAYYYDYQALVRPSPTAYVYVCFKTHALSSGLFGRALDRYLVRYASEELTLTNGLAVQGNQYAVQSCEREDNCAVLFENQVELKLATLRRQLVATRDGESATLTGPREIYETLPRRGPLT
jgi:hypothetical protein